MRIGSLFSGIGGLELGLEQAGVGHTVWQVEQSEFCRSVLAKHWPDAERFDDVKTVGASNLSRVDLICGGFPCQDISRLGKGEGLDGSSSGLWFEYARIVEELQPRWVVVENVESGAEHWVDAVGNRLAELGYEALPVPLSAVDVGAPHERARIFIIACYADKDRESMVSIDEEVAKLPGPTASLPRWCKRPSISMDDGLPGAMAALGNAVVPQCAEVIGRMIVEMDK